MVFHLLPDLQYVTPSWLFRHRHNRHTDTRSVDSFSCQKVLLLENKEANIKLQNIITIGAKYSIVQDGIPVPASDNLNVDSYPDWSQISVFFSIQNQVFWIDPAIWNSDNPTVYCSPPCVLKLPPWKNAMSTIDYSFITAAGSVEIRPPITVDEWVLERVTVQPGAAGKGKRADQPITTIFPSLASIPQWPTFTFVGKDNRVTRTVPFSPTHPPPPASTMPAPSPLSGYWPERGLTINFGPIASPTVKPCQFRHDPQCDGWEYAAMGSAGQLSLNDPDPDITEVGLEEAMVICPAPKSSTNTNKPAPIPTSISIPVPAPTSIRLPTPDHSNNHWKCFGYPRADRQRHHLILWSVTR